MVAYNEPGYYLRSFVVPRTAVLPPDQRTYQMFANPQLFNTSFGPNSPAAMHAIITHECASACLCMVSGGADVVPD